MKRTFFSVLFALGLCIASVPSSAQQQMGLAERAQNALESLFQALAGGDRQIIANYLAPEFQIVRSNGAVYDKTGYLDRSIPVIRTTPRFKNLKVTGQADIRVVTFNLEVDELIDGRHVENLAPQLIVFRDLGDRWIVIATANLAKLSQ